VPSWERLKELFEGLADLAPEERVAYLDRVCGSDASMRAEIQRLLDADEKAGSFMRVPAVHWTSSTASESPAVFSPGEKVAGRFRIIRFLGQGGMGQVYQAEDEVLGGLVALKTVRPEIASDKQTFERFKQEVRLAKEVTDENVCRVYDLDHHNVPPFITMELVEGETLSARLRREGKMTMAEALPLVQHMAHGLHAAHEKGIIHRDFKPGNVMLTRTDSGEALAKVTDFGLARTAECDNTSVPGKFTGTPGYMAPELLEGARATVASDIYALGLVVYEMVTGAKPGYQRLTEPAPSPRKQVPDLDEKWESAILQCLERDPSRRFSSAAEVVRAIRGETSRFDRMEDSIRRHPAALVASAVVITLIALVRFLLPPPIGSNQETELTQVTTDSGLSTYPAISPDGKWVAYASDRSGAGNLDIWIQQIGGGEPIRLTQDPSDDYDPAFSPDGTRIVFRSERDHGGIYLVSMTGGEAQLFARGGFGPRFSPDGKWIAYWTGSPGSGFVPGSSQIYLKALSGGAPQPFHPEFSANFWPIWSPDGKQVLFVGVRKEPGEGNRKGEDWWIEAVDWWIAAVDGGPARRTGAIRALHAHEFTAPVGQDFITPNIWDSSGRQVLFSATRKDSTNIWELPLSATSGQINGPPRRRTSGTGVELHASLAEESPGRLCYDSEVLHVDVRGMPIAANTGRLRGPMQKLTQGLSYAASPSISADGTRLAFTGFRSGKWTVRMRDLATRREKILASSDRNWLRARISPDGTKVAYVNYRDEMYLVDFSRDTTEKICDRCGPPTDFSADGQRLLLESLDPPENVMTIDLASRKNSSIVDHPAHPDWILYGGRFSPDGRWIAFHASVDRSLNKKIFITPVGDGHSIGETAWVPVTDGSNVDWHVSWSPDGNLVYFLSDRDGFRCIWGQRLNHLSKQPLGAPFAVQHFHRTSQSLRELDRVDVIGMAVVRGQMVFAVGELTGGIWLSEIKAGPESWLRWFRKRVPF
jgi:serine/threonine protein kinase